MTRRVAPALAALVLACGGGGGLKPGDPAQLLTQAGSAILSVHTLAADLKFSQGAVMFQGFALSSAEARVSLPSDSDATYKVRQGDLLVAIGVILVGGRTFLRPPFGVYGELTPAQAKDIPDLARLFDPQRALPAVVPAGRDPRYLGADRIDGVDCHRLEAVYSAVQVHQLLDQLNSAGDVTATIWVGGSDHLIRKARLAGPFGDAGKAATVEVHLHDFNQPVSIAPPA